MGMGKDKLIDLVAVVAIALIGLLTAYVCFGLLQSQATTDGSAIPGYSLGGAIAGALATVSLLSTIYLRIRKSSGDLQQLRDENQNELQKLRESNQELQQKLIRGAPRPKGFDTEVSELEKIVLARPRDWTPRGGVIFEYELPKSEARKGDEFRARFRCTYSMISKDGEAQQPSPDDDEAIRQCYERVRENTLNDACVESHTSEYVYLGG